MLTQSSTLNPNSHSNGHQSSDAAPDKAQAVTQREQPRPATVTVTAPTPAAPSTSTPFPIPSSQHMAPSWLFARYKRTKRKQVTTKKGEDENKYADDGAAAAAVSEVAGQAAESAAPPILPSNAILPDPSYRAPPDDGEYIPQDEECDPDSILTAANIDYLFQHQLRTAEDILTVDEDCWRDDAHFPRSLLQRLQAAILDSHRTMVTGNTLRKMEMEMEREVMSTGNESIDALLDGGVWAGEVTEVVAASCVGKSQLCMQVAGWASASERRRVCVIDTSKSFDVIRVKEIVTKALKLQGKELDLDAYSSLLDGVRVMSVFTAAQLLETLEALRTTMKEQPKSQRPQLLVIDSLGAAMAPIIGSASGRGNALIADVIRHIKSIAHEYQLAVLTTNYTVAQKGGNTSTLFLADLRPALGETWSLLADTRISLEAHPHMHMHAQSLTTSSYSQRASQHESRTDVRIKLVKSPRKARGGECVCELSAAGYL